MKLLILIFICLISFEGSSQQSLDSLFSNLNGLKSNDTSKLNTAILICKKLIRIGEYKRVIRFADTAFLIEKSCPNETKKAMIMINKAIGYTYTSYYPEAITLYYQALSVFNKNNNALGAGKCYTNLGIIFYEQKQLTKSLGFYLKAADIALKLKVVKHFPAPRALLFLLKIDNA